MRITIDEDVDAAYIQLTEAEVAYSRRLDDRRILDYDDDGSPRGIELLYVSDGVNVRDLPDQEAICRLLEAHGIRSLAA